MEVSDEITNLWGKINLKHAQKLNIDNRDEEI